MNQGTVFFSITDRPEEDITPSEVRAAFERVDRRFEVIEAEMKLLRAKLETRHDRGSRMGDPGRRGNSE